MEPVELDRRPQNDSGLGGLFLPHLNRSLPPPRLSRAGSFWSDGGRRCRFSVALYTLFRREQLRLVLGYLRDERPAEYVATLRELLEAPTIRFHLKHLVLQFLGLITEPRDEEIELVLELIGEEGWRTHVMAEVVNGYLPWFEILDDRGLFEEWLDSDEEELLERALSHLRWIAPRAGDRVARHLEVYEAKGGHWPRRLFSVLPFQPEKDSPRLFELRLRLVQLGHYERLIGWKALTTADFGRFLQLSSLLIARCAVEVATKERRFRDNWPWHDLADVDLTQADEERLSLAWVALLKAFGLLLRAHEDRFTGHGIFIPGKLDDRAWRPVVGLLGNIASRLAQSNWRHFAALTMDSDNLPKVSKLIAMQTFANGPKDFALADWVLAWFMDDPDRLRWRYEASEEETAMAGRLIERLAPHCSEEHYRRLEGFLLEYEDPGFKRHYLHRYEYRNRREHRAFEWPSLFGETAHKLLPRLPRERRSRRVKKRIQELNRKFGAVPEISKGRGMGGVVGSPISHEEIRGRLSDRTWLQIIGNAKIPPRNRSRWRELEPGMIAESSVRMFAKELREVASRQPERFARLALRIPESAPVDYVAAILQALSTTSLPRGAPEEEREEWRPASHESMEAVLRLPVAMMSDEYARDYCWVLRYHPRHPWSEDIVLRLASIARHHPDPEPGQFDVHGFESFSDHLVSNAPNCTRGAAAYTLRALLFEHPQMLSTLGEAIESLVKDPHPAVRLSSVATLLPVLKSDREQAITWFLEACHDADERMLACREVHHFLLYTAYLETEQLEDLLVKMTGSDHSPVVHAGAYHVARAFFFAQRLESLFTSCLEGSTAARSGVARAAADLLPNRDYHAAAKEILGRFLNDDDQEVLKKVAWAFEERALEIFSPTDPFLADFAKSEAFVRFPDALLRTLNKYTGSLIPVAPCLLAAGHALADRAAVSLDSKRRLASHSYELVPLLLTLYEQSSSDPAREALHHKCLDLWDKLLEQRLGETSDLLKKINLS